jgi:uncharacterized protein YkwD
MLRSFSLRFVCVCALAAALGAPVADASPQHSGSSLSSLTSGVLTQLNMIRTAHHLARLRINPGLAEAATQHSTEMTNDGYFAHTSVGGGAFWKRLERYYPQRNSGSWSVGENLLWTSGTLDPQQAVAMWMASPDHRANILNPTWREIVISSVSATAAPGAYDGLNVIVITTDFGARQ